MDGTILTQCAKTFLHRLTPGTVDYMVELAAKEHGLGFENYLSDGEVVVSASGYADTGINLVGVDIVNSGRSVLAWISGGEIGITYAVNIYVTTSFSYGGLSRSPAFAFNIKVI